MLFYILQISITEKKKNSKRGKEEEISTEDLCGNCKRILSESVNFDNDNDVHLVSISSVQLHMWIEFLNCVRILWWFIGAPINIIVAMLRYITLKALFIICDQHFL